MDVYGLWKERACFHQGFHFWSSLQLREALWKRLQLHAASHLLGWLKPLAAGVLRPDTTGCMPQLGCYFPFFRAFLTKTYQNRLGCLMVYNQDGLFWIWLEVLFKSFAVGRLQCFLRRCYGPYCKPSGTRKILWKKLWNHQTMPSEEASELISFAPGGDATARLLQWRCQRSGSNEEKFLVYVSG